MNKTRQASDRAWQAIRKNLLINGCFRFWQRATSHSTYAVGSDDRWWLPILGDSASTNSRQSFTLGQTDVPGNPQYFCRNVVTAGTTSNSLVAKYQLMEGVETTAGKTLTLSFWAKASASLNMSTEFVQVFGTGGSPSTEVTGIGGVKHALTTSWQKFTATGTMPSISGKTLGTNGNDGWNVSFWFDAGSDYDTRTNSLGHQSGTFDIAQVQVEIGDHATEFEHRDDGTELALCQRYYEKSYDTNVTPGSVTYNGRDWINVSGLSVTAHNAGQSVKFTTTKRAQPTVIVYSPNSGTSGKVFEGGGGDVNATVTDAGRSGFRWYATTASASATAVNFSIHWTADAEL